MTLNVRMDRIYHITTMREVERAARIGTYAPQNMQANGFIHCAYANQIRSVAESKFRGSVGLALMEIDIARIGCPIRDEISEAGGQPFPHVYGAVPMQAVTAVRELSVPNEGHCELPCNVDA